MFFCCHVPSDKTLVIHCCWHCCLFNLSLFYIIFVPAENACHPCIQGSQIAQMLLTKPVIYIQIWSEWWGWDGCRPSLMTWSVVIWMSYACLSSCDGMYIDICLWQYTGTLTFCHPHHSHDYLLIPARVHLILLLMRLLLNRYNAGMCTSQNDWGAQHLSISLSLMSRGQSHEK